MTKPVEVTQSEFVLAVEIINLVTELDEVDALDKAPVDIVERLEKYRHEANRELRAENERLRKALKGIMPFLEEYWCDGEDDSEPVGHFAHHQTGEAIPLPLTFGHIKRARQSLQETGDDA